MIKKQYDAADMDKRPNTGPCPFPQLVSAVDPTGSAILITNALGVIVWVNAAFTRLSGYDLLEIAGSTSTLLAAGHNTVFPYLGLWQNSQEDGIAWYGELENRSKFGTLYITEEFVTPVLGDQGEVTHYIAIQHDVTPRRRPQRLAEQAVQHA
ncbi:MAG: PAS domain-containing protein [Pseudomonadota bacterium]